MVIIAKIYMTALQICAYVECIAPNRQTWYLTRATQSTFCFSIVKCPGHIKSYMEKTHD